MSKPRKSKRNHSNVRRRPDADVHAKMRGPIEVYPARGDAASAAEHDARAARVLAGVQNEGSKSGDLWPDLSRTAAALDVYDARERELDRLLETVEDDQEVVMLFSVNDSAWREVLEAFASETQDSNDRRTIERMNAPAARRWLRGLVERWKRRGEA